MFLKTSATYGEGRLTGTGNLLGNLARYKVQNSVLVIQKLTTSHDAIKSKEARHANPVSRILSVVALFTEHLLGEANNKFRCNKDVFDVQHSREADSL